MMEREKDELVEALIGRKLGLADEEDAARLEETTKQVQQLEAALDQVLRPLAAWKAPDAPADLNRRIMGRIESINKTISFEEAASAAVGAPAERRGGWYFSIRDLVAAAACITILVGLFVPGYRNARSIYERNLCQSNISRMYAGLSSFAQEHDGILPYADAGRQAAERSAQAIHIQPGANSRHLWYLLQKKYVPSARVFICPSRRHDVAANVSDIASRGNFPTRANNSYSLQSMEGRYRVTLQVDPNMVILGDANPLFDGDVITALLGTDRPLNSNSHGDGKGQNVLYASGRVTFVQNPNVGVAGDHIYQAGDLIEHPDAVVPQYETDSFLVP